MGAKTGFTGPGFAPTAVRVGRATWQLRRGNKVSISTEGTARVPEFEPYTTIGPDALLSEAAKDLDLVEHLRELEQDGYTVVPPEKVGSARFLHDLEAAVRECHRRRSEANPALMKAVGASGAGEITPYALWDDPIFEKALMNPVAQTLARALTGHAGRLSLFGASVKPAGNAPLGLHCDTAMTEPYPIVPQFGNVTYALTDYSEENGSTIFVPGSHRLLRQPVGSEVDGMFGVTGGVAGMYAPQIPAVRPVNARAGSIIAWSGLTWHGAVPRRASGERVSLLMYFCRWYLKTQANFRDHVPLKSLERWKDHPRFAQVLDINPVWGFAEETMHMAKGTEGREVLPILDVGKF